MTARLPRAHRRGQAPPPPTAAPWKGSTVNDSPPTPETPSVEHLAECFGCWLDALGVDHQLAATIARVAFAVGVGTGAGAVAARTGIPFDVVTAAAADVHQPDDRKWAAIERGVRKALAVPASPDVAAAAQGYPHG